MRKATLGRGVETVNLHELFARMSNGASRVLESRRTDVRNVFGFGDL
jgi:hypothetical protein